MVLIEEKTHYYLVLDRLCVMRVFCFLLGKMASCATSYSACRIPTVNGLSSHMKQRKTKYRACSRWGQTKNNLLLHQVPLSLPRFHYTRKTPLLMLRDTAGVMMLSGMWLARDDPHYISLTLIYRLSEFSPFISLSLSPSPFIIHIDSHAHTHTRIDNHSNTHTDRHKHNTQTFPQWIKL